MILDERSLGATGTICPTCNQMTDPRLGRWVAKNPDASWGDGFWVCHPMVPWLDYQEIRERFQNYDLPTFKNEVLGLSTTTGDHVVTREELDACCGEFAMARSIADIPPAGAQSLIAGIDWGGGGTSRTVLVIGFMRDDFTFQILRMERFAATEDPDYILRSVATRCNEFGVFCLAADAGGNGQVYNRLLLGQVNQSRGLYAIFYSLTDGEPFADGMLTRWTVSRSGTLGAVFSRIKKKMLLFPRKEDSNTYLEEFACQITEYDDYSRTMKYTHPDSQLDDALHATNYALLVAIRHYHAQHRAGLFDLGG